MNAQNHFQSETIFLRPFEPEYQAALQGYLNHPQLTGRRYLPWGIPDDLPLTQAQVGKVIERWQEGEKGLRLAVVNRADERLIGHVDCDWEWDALHAGLSVVIAPQWQRKGYGTSAARLAIGHLFASTPANSVSAWIDDWNEAGLAFATALGFQPCGGMRWSGLRAGKPYDTLVFDLLRSEWKGQEVSHAAGR